MSIPSLGCVILAHANTKLEEWLKVTYFISSDIKLKCECGIIPRHIAGQLYKHIECNAPLHCTILHTKSKGKWWGISFTQFNRRYDLTAMYFHWLRAAVGVVSQYLYEWLWILAAFLYCRSGTHYMFGFVQCTLRTTPNKMFLLQIQSIALC